MRTRKRFQFGQRKSACLRRRLHVFTVIQRRGSATISGSMAQGHADLVLRFIMTEESNMAAESLTVRWAATVTVLWKYGITCSRSLTVTARATMRSLRRKTLIPVWD